MILEGLTVFTVAKLFNSVDKSIKMDERALNKYAKAFELKEEAALMVKNKAEYADKRLGNVARKKRAIISVTVPKFVEVYSQIQKINLTLKNKDFEIALANNNLQPLTDMSISYKKDFTDKELVCGLIFKGLGKMIEKDSERFLSSANNQLSSANVIYSQAESIVAVYDAIIERADRIAKLLMQMNALFVRSIQETDETIKRNGLDVRNYSDYDKGVLMICVNMAKAMSDIINVPVVDESGAVCQSAVAMIENGESYIQKMNKTIGG